MNHSTVLPPAALSVALGLLLHQLRELGLAQWCRR